jgi:hypothetical protein
MLNMGLSGQCVPQIGPLREIASQATYFGQGRPLSNSWSWVQSPPSTFSFWISTRNSRFPGQFTIITEEQEQSRRCKYFVSPTDDASHDQKLETLKDTKSLAFHVFCSCRQPSCSGICQHIWMFTEEFAWLITKMQLHLHYNQTCNPTHCKSLFGERN